MKKQIEAVQHTPGPFTRDAWEAAVLAAHPTARVYGTYHGAMAFIADPNAYQGRMPVGDYDRIAKGMCWVAVTKATGAGA